MGTFSVLTIAQWHCAIVSMFIPRLVEQTVQTVSKKFPVIKEWVDGHKVAGQFWLSESQQFLMMKDVSESLAGRVAILKLLGLSQAERVGRRGVLLKSGWCPTRSRHGGGRSVSLKTLSDRVIRGTFPRLYTKPAVDLDVYYSSYVQTYLERDVRDLASIGNLADFERFLRVCAARTAQVLNITDMARDVGVAPNTAKKWLSVLEASFQVFVLKPCFRNLTKRVVRMPKLFFLDTGLLAYLTGWKSAETIFSGAMAGAFFETFVVSEIVKSWWNRGAEPPIWYWRTKEKEEVDLVFDINGELFPVEIKLTTRPGGYQLWSLNKFMATMSSRRGSVVCLSQERFPISPKISMIPISEIG